MKYLAREWNYTRHRSVTAEQ